MNYKVLNFIRKYSPNSRTAGIRKANVEQAATAYEANGLKIFLVANCAAGSLKYVCFYSLMHGPFSSNEVSTISTSSRF